MSQSEVARIKQQIAQEYEAAQRVLMGFTPTAKHEYITKRQENLGDFFEELKLHMTPKEAMGIFIELTVEKKNIYPHEQKQT